jgi:hypothetical protein
MFGYPQVLNDQGMFNAGAALGGGSDFLFSIPKGGRTFYSIRNGNWNDPTVWSTVQGTGGLPTEVDDVYILHNIIFNTASSIKNLYISQLASLIFDNSNSQRVLSIGGNIKSYGLIDARTSTGFGLTLNLFGNDNIITNYLSTNSINNSRVVYASNNPQDILPIKYCSLGISGVGIKYAKSNIVVENVLEASTDTTLELSEFDLDVNRIGSGSVEFGGRLSKSLPGKILIRGEWRFGPSSRYIFSGNPEIEIRSGIIGSGVRFRDDSRFYLGTNKLRFTTNNQSITASNVVTLVLHNEVLIEDITLTIDVTPTNNIIVIENSINGTTPTSTLINRGTINFTTQTAAENSMTVGTVDFTTSANTIGYTGNYSATIPSRFPNFHNLSISGTGTKTLSTNSTLNGNLSIVGNTSGLVTLECSSFDLTIIGTTTLGGGNTTFPNTLSKSSSGNILFGGVVSQTSNNSARFNFSGNPNIEMRGGINSGAFTWLRSNFNTGTGNWTFTNNQSITGGFNSTFDFNGPVLISDNTAVTINGTTGNLLFRINNTLNGIGANSILRVGGISSTSNSILVVTNSNPIMSTGILDYLTSAFSIIQYEMNFDYSLPYSQYNGLWISGTSGVKSLSTNTTVSNMEIFGSTFDCLTYDLTNSGITRLSGGSFNKSGGGNILFINTFQLTNNGCIMNLSGNPNVEFRNGFVTSNLDFSNGQLTTGTGTWSFTTNNQTLGGSFFRINPINANILVGSNITLTYSNGGNSAITGQINGVIDGSNSNSRFRLNTNTQVNYQNPTVPMSTGILDTSTNLNTFIYGNGNQNIKGGTYRNLTLNGGGTKTLQGNVSVQNTYTLTSPATLNNNGFTLTNP